jgi:hypothetical protein
MKDNAQRAKNSILMFWILLALKCFSMVALTYLYFGIRNESQFTLNNYSTLFQAIAIFDVFLIGFFIANIVVFLMWFRRAYYNHNTIFPYYNHNEAAAAWSWFIPIVNLYLPVRIMREIWTDFQHEATDGTENQDFTLINTWWALWISSNILGQIGQRLYNNTSYMFIALAFIFSVAALILLIHIIKKIAVWEDRLMNNHVEEDITIHLLS